MQQSLFASAIATASEPESAGSAWEKTPLSQAVFTVIDLETTGLNAKRNAITEVTAIQFQNGKEVKKFSTLVKPTEPIPPECIAITGITNEMVQDAPPLISVLTDLCGFVGPSPVIVGHNVPFDIKFIQEKLSQSGLAGFGDRFALDRALCTKALAVKAIPGLPSYEGIVVATACDVVNPNPHRAEADVRMSAGILFALITRLQGAQTLNPSATVQDLLDFQGSLS